MKLCNFIRAIRSGKKLYRVQRNGKTRRILGSSVQQVESKFPKWLVKKGWL